MEPFADAVGLRVADFGSSMFDVVNCQVELVIMTICLTAILSFSVSEDSKHRLTLRSIERQHAIIEQVCSSNQRLRGVQLALSYLGISVDISLLVNTPNTFEGADVKRVLSSQITRVYRVDFSAGLVIQLLAF